MAKKKAKKKIKKVKRIKKSTKKKKPLKRKKIVKAKVKVKKLSGQKEKAVGLVDHFFGHISVAAFKVKSPLKVGDMIHVKGHTTDFVQRVDSIQSNHQSIPLAKKGVEVGIKVKDKCRTGDTVFFAAKEQGIAAPPPKKIITYENKKFLSF